MKRLIYIVLVILVGCKVRNSIIINNNQHSISKIKADNRNFIIGDINNDKDSDTAYESYKINIDTNDIECEEADCSINVKFNKIFPI